MNYFVVADPIKCIGCRTCMIACVVEHSGEDIFYENDNYTELRKYAPDVGDIVETNEGPAKVLSCDVLNRNLKVKYVDEDNKFGYLKLDDVKFTPSKDKKKHIEIEEFDDADSL